MTRPRFVGRYALYERIAAGGAATVHLGRLLGPVGFTKVVAIKRLHDDYAREPGAAEMLIAEARVAARIRHPNVAAMLDVVATGDEIFLVMEYVEGESLAHLLRAARERREDVPVPIVAAIVAGLLRGLAAVHETRDEKGDPLGLVHRDVSPQNTLVGVDGIPRVLDFGIAKPMNAPRSTRTGEVKGKLAYLAPELFKGARATVRSDLYAVAIILWEALSGRSRLDVDTPLDAPSSSRSGVPPALDAVVLRGLAADPSARFASAEEMSIAIESVCDTAKVSEVKTWVDALAHDRLVESALRVRAIESGEGDAEKPATAPRASEEETATFDRVPNTAAPEESTTKLVRPAPSPAGPLSADVVTETISRPRMADVAFAPTEKADRPHLADAAFAPTEKVDRLPLTAAENEATLQSHASAESTVPNAAGPAARRRRAVVAAVGAFVAAIAVGALGTAWIARARAHAETRTAPVESAPASIESATNADALSNDAGETTASKEPSSSAPTSMTKRRVTPVGSPRRGPRPDCSSVFTIDEAGHKHYKPECLRWPSPQ